jgi:serine/threonine-protein kinase
MSLIPGTRLGPYEITAAIGAGGMGEVYSARDSRLHRLVAIKTLPPAFSADANRLARFQREAQALAALSHPNIAAIYGLEESGGTTALVMELIDGPTLAERIAAGPIPVADALAIARQIGAALEAAHEKGIVHRDLKPANIKLTAEGQVKVLDFGLAKAMDKEASSGAPPANSPTLTLESTTAGMIMGTAAYMSPEQARGKPVDKRADIWAFGVVFLEMLTGRSPFEGETVSDTLAGVLRADIDLKTLPANTPPAIRRLIEHCLQKDPKRRLRDIGDAWIEIDSPVDTAVPVAAVPPAKTSRMPWIACGAAVLVAIAAIAWALMHKPAVSPQPVVRWSYAPDRILVGLSLSHDGSRLVYMEVAQTPTLAMRMMDQLEPKPIPDTFGAFPTFSPDGQWIAFLTPVRPYQLKKMPVSGGTAITLCDYPGTGRGIAWGDDGNIVMDGPKGLMRVSSSGGTPEAITTIDPAKHETAHGWPFVMPGSQAILFTISRGSSSDAAAVDLRTHAIHVLAKSASVPHYAASGHLIYRRTETLFAAPFNASRLEVTGPEAPVVEHVAGINTDGGDYTISDGGLLVYMSGGGAGEGGPTVLNWADRKGALEPVSEPKQWGTGRLSPDMSHVANGILAGDNEDIWTYDLVRRTPLRLTFEGKNSNPIWSPDGRWITFAGVRKGKTALYRVAADASGKPELLLETEANAVPNSWSPDGKTLVFTQPGPDNLTHLWSVTVPGGKSARLHESDAAELNGEVSPDGHWLAYESSESGNNEIYLQPFPGSGAKARISTHGGSVPRWSHNGKEIFFWNYNNDRQLFVVDLQPGTVFRAGLPQALFKARAGTTWDVAADGKRFLVETPASAGNGRRMEVVVNWFDELNRRVPVKK